MPQRRRTRKKKSATTELEKTLEAEAAAQAKVRSEKEIKVEVEIKPPPSAVKSIRELIYWEYAKLIAKAAGFADNYRFIMSRFMKLKNGTMRFSEIDKDDKKQLTMKPACIYCRSKKSLTYDHIIPVSCGGPDIQSNVVLACSSCNSSKGDKDIFEWYFLVQKKKEIPRLVWSKYLKLVWDFHVAHRTIDRVDINRDGTLNVLDLGAIFKPR